MGSVLMISEMVVQIATASKVATDQEEVGPSKLCQIPIMAHRKDGTGSLLELLPPGTYRYMSVLGGTGACFC